MRTLILITVISSLLAITYLSLLILGLEGTIIYILIFSYFLYWLTKKSFLNSYFKKNKEK